MGWITRRVAGYIVFSVVAGVLGAIAISQGYIVGDPTLSTVCGAVILGLAFLVSLHVTSRMKQRSRVRKALKENERAWQEYYARAYPPAPPRR